MDGAFWAEFGKALLLQAGWNAAVVCLGAAALGAGAGVVGVFALLRGRAMMSDAISHATLPGVAAAFLLVSAWGGDARALPAMLIGGSVSAALGVLAVQWISARTRLGEDAAIGTVLSSFFAVGVALLTVIQQLPLAGQAGVERLLIGSAAGMLDGERETIMIVAGVLCVIAIALTREFAAIAFDPAYAASLGWPVRALDLLLMALLLAIVVIGLTTVGLVLIIALAIAPPATARFWCDRARPMALISGGVGAVGCYVGAALSASGDNLPTGAVIVLCLAAVFALSLLLSPQRGIVAALLRRRRLQNRVHLRQGLLAVARSEPIFDARTVRILCAAGYLRGDGAPTEAGAVAAKQMARDQALWNLYRDLHPEEAFALADWSLRPIDEVLPPDLVAGLMEQLAQARRGGIGAA
ncbi:MAG: metal ABC transporter permease [Neomegalonema sp.]|nr:metal ABC transporter permease [Neomegalonema sp.]